MASRLSDSGARVVLHLVQDLNSGGLEQIIRAITTRLDPGKWRVEVWALAGGGAIADAIGDAGVTVRILSLKNCYSPVSILSLAQRMRAVRPAIVHTHGYFADTLGRLAAIAAGVPVRITHLHTTFHGLSFVNKLVDRILNRFTAAIIVISRGVRRSFEQAGYDMSAAVKIPNGVDGATFSPVSPPPGPPSILCVASLSPQKGHRYLLDAMTLVAAECPDARLMLAGDGPLRKELEQQGAALGIAARVTFLGRRTDIPALLHQAHLLVLSSVREGVPVSVLEAMACGIPVVATRVGGLAEVVEEGVTGLLVEPRDPAALARAIIAVCRDAAGREAMGKAGRQRFEQVFTVEQMVGGIQKLYERCLHEQR
jgi:glycosyltransferase involved in cell wall biosynthesis